MIKALHAISKHKNVNYFKTSNRHVQAANWMPNYYQEVDHYYNIWQHWKKYNKEAGQGN